MLPVGVRARGRGTSLLVVILEFDLAEGNLEESTTLHIVESGELEGDRHEDLDVSNANFLHRKLRAEGSDGHSGCCGGSLAVVIHGDGKESGTCNRK